jgi:hypothetical protein
MSKRTDIHAMSLSTSSVSWRHRVGGILALATIPIACGGESPMTGRVLEEPSETFLCDLDPAFFRSGGLRRDAIPALTDPIMVRPENAADLAYLGSDDRVVGVVLDGQPIAIPHNILYHHEIVNLNGTQTRVAISYCPLTGSALAFDRAVVEGAEFGVSGLLYQSNLIMYDRNADDSLWPQMFGEARCGPRNGTRIPRVSSFEMTWHTWERLYPQTVVVSQNTGFERDYAATSNPYREYEQTSAFWFDMPTPDHRRPPKERVLGIPNAAGVDAVAFPFGDLEVAGSRLVIETRVGGEDAIVLWDAEARSAAAFRPRIGNRAVTLTVSGESFQDTITGSLFQVDGLARVGPLSGQRLEPIEDAFIAFWGAWTAFHPSTALWRSG